MSTTVSITVPKPCHEDWNKMTPTEKGAFCGSCQKVVIDFSSMSPDEIKAYLLLQAGKKVCGRFNSNQLNSLQRVEVPLYLLPKRLSAGKAFLVSLLLVFGTSLFSCTSTEGRIVGEIAAVENPPPKEHVTEGDTVKMGQVAAPQPKVAPADSTQKVKKVVKRKPVRKTVGEVEMIKGDVAIEPVEVKPMMGKVCIRPEEEIKK